MSMNNVSPIFYKGSLMIKCSPSLNSISRVNFAFIRPAIISQTSKTISGAPARHDYPPLFCNAVNILRQIL
ncbi:hypothetical protein E1J03_00470 [Phocaeicola dorei]|uniref:Uncharacterized protein n=3 Tax=Phocaeicola TaxID=909656 RepID=A0A412ZD57_9BACT|nr:hypothetical protein F2A23_14055 [Akkermansia sp. BIOML-A63]KAA5294745.1 hypothetical protein F2Z06_03915 [Phocaeicola dorei]MSS48525.1 hypothetical protein [Phocaeicola vulgatus]RGD34501.1 hypothetical protein DW230_08810 [Bacteroides sp. AM18-9]RGL97473.1 hypothetical protein DXC38_15180 [Bacteroides sp. 3_1_33FAA]RJU74850.1 hypothetical protein DW750_02945 [Bacteroides sp. AM28-6]RJV58761.1 hypothetical protein DWW63_10645 [Bacteroides sp. AF16-29]RJX03816.1 hypothetical protein DWW74_